MASVTAARLRKLADEMWADAKAREDDDRYAVLELVKALKKYSTELHGIAAWMES